MAVARHPQAWAGRRRRREVGRKGGSEGGRALVREVFGRRLVVWGRGKIEG